MIDNVMPQPYPLHAVLVVPDRWEYAEYRVIGWVRKNAAKRGELSPVLAYGAKTWVPDEEVHIDYFDTADEARRNGPSVAEAARRIAEEDAAKAK